MPNDLAIATELKDENEMRKSPDPRLSSANIVGVFFVLKYKSIIVIFDWNQFEYESRAL